MLMADWQIGRLGHFDVSVIYLPQKLRTSASNVTDISQRGGMYLFRIYLTPP